jgi:hypothetical protein
MDKSQVGYVPAREKKGAKKPAAAKPLESQFAKHLLPGTQQPAPAVLICAAKGENVAETVRWLNAQEVHAFVLVEGAASAAQALGAIRARAAEWQVKADAVGVMGGGAAAAAAARACGDADFAVLLDVDRARVINEVPEAKRKTTFVGNRGESEKGLAAWLEKRKGKVF